MVRAVTPIPFVKARFFDRCGKPLAGGKVYTYEANTTTAKTTYKDPYGLTPNTNPIILDAAGEADIYLDGTYRIRITDRNDVLVNDVAKIGSWFSDNLQDTLDNISGAMDDALKPILQNLDEAINTAAAAGAGANGWDDMLIAVSENVNQRQINDGLDTIAQLLAIRNPRSGQRVYVKSYYAGLNKGGGEFVYDSTKASVNDGGLTISGWVRHGYTYITPEMFGAMGDAITNDLIAFESCLKIGGDIRLTTNKQYLLKVTGLNSYKDRDILSTSTSIKLSTLGGGTATLIFSHDAPNGSPGSLVLGSSNGTLIDGVLLKDIVFQGNPIRGIADKTKRAKGVQLRGVSNFVVDNCTFSTLQTHNLHIVRANGDTWYDAINPNSANKAESVQALLALSSKNGLIKNSRCEYIGTNGMAIFGGDNITIDGYSGVVDLTNGNGKFTFLILVDDASDYTPLKDYALNRNINITNAITNGDISISGLNSGSITKSTFRKFVCASYDFNQQINNFGLGTNANQTSDHLAAPFVWLDYLPDGTITLNNNHINSFNIAGGRCAVRNNTIASLQDSSKLITLTLNSIKWSDAISYVAKGKPNIITDNIILLNHNNITIVGTDVNAASSDAVVNNNTVTLKDASYTFIPMQGINTAVRRNSYIVDTLTEIREYKEHPTNYRQQMLTQGLGYNHYKNFINVYDNSPAVAIARFTQSTAKVVLTISYLTVDGRSAMRKVSISPTNVITSENLDTSTGFTETIYDITNDADGNRTLLIKAIALNFCAEITGIGSRTDCKFLPIPPRATPYGG